MITSGSSVTEFAGTIRQCIVGLSRLAALLFVLQLTIFTALGPPASVSAEDIVSSSAHTLSAEGAQSSAGDPVDESMRSVNGLVQVTSRLAVLILVPLLGILLLMSPFVAELNCRHLFLAMVTAVGLLPLVLLDFSSSPWAAGALPHLTNTLLKGGVVPLVATISMMSVAILLGRPAQPYSMERMISNPAASRISAGLKSGAMDGE